MYIVEITYNDREQTLHGPFKDQLSAQEWMDDRPDDPQVEEMEVLYLNKVEV